MGLRQLIDAFSGGSTDSKIPQEVFDLINQIAMKNYKWGSTRSRVKLVGLHSMDMLTVMEPRLAAMIEKKMVSGNLVSSQPTTQQVLLYDFCNSGHPNHKFLVISTNVEHVDYMQGN